MYHILLFLFSLPLRAVHVLLSHWVVTVYFIFAFSSSSFSRSFVCFSAVVWRMMFSKPLLVRKHYLNSCNLITVYRIQTQINTRVRSVHHSVRYSRLTNVNIRHIYLQLIVHLTYRRFSLSLALSLSLSRIGKHFQINLWLGQFLRAFLCLFLLFSYLFSHKIRSIFEESVYLYFYIFDFCCCPMSPTSMASCVNNNKIHYFNWKRARAGGRYKTRRSVRMHKILIGSAVTAIDAFLFIARTLFRRNVTRI